MIKLVIKINEEMKEKFENVTATGLNVEIEEIQMNATKGELKGSKFIKERLNYDKKLQIINESKIKNENINEKLNRIVNDLFN